MLDFSNEEDQRVGGPIPKGSCVKVRLRIRVPRSENKTGEYFFRSEKGLVGLDAEYEVVAGSYTGNKIWEIIWLPKQHQNIQLTDGQVKACNMAGSKIKAILSASRNTDSNYQMRDWLALDAVEFGVIVGISKEANSKGYWNNTIAKIITPSMNHYKEVMSGCEVITDGPVTGDVVPQNHGHDDSFNSGTAFPSEASGMSDVPF